MSDEPKGPKPPRIRMVMPEMPMDTMMRIFREQKVDTLDEKTLVDEALKNGCPTESGALNILSIMEQRGQLTKSTDGGVTRYTVNKNAGPTRH